MLKPGFVLSARDHPRTGGEKPSTDFPTWPRSGSPPHGRGKARPYRAAPVALGITPARAGKRTTAAAICRSCRDHPRVGGEKLFRVISGVSIVGSPPRKRGKVHDFDQIGRSAGITPAWAGKRPWMPSDSSSSRDHPRVGGEKLALWPAVRKALGSPPRRRGKACPCTSQAGYSRITPAWAGKSYCPATRSFWSWDHPRMGREKTMYFEDKYFCRGSPPRRRGKEIRRP